MTGPLATDTSLRFLGQLPLAAGLIVAGVAAAAAAWFYLRETRLLGSPLRLVLPALRSLAIAMALLLLTGPVLHHRETIGQLGRVTLLVDASESMNRVDPQLPLDRKIRIALAGGWLPPSTLDLAPIDHADQLDAIAAAAPELSTQTLRERLTAIAADVDAGTAGYLDDRVLSRLRRDETGPETVISNEAAAAAIGEIADDLRTRFAEDITLRTNSGDQTVAAAIAIVDEQPRIDRMRAVLTHGGDDSLLARLRATHEVTLEQITPDGRQPLAIDKPIAAVGASTDLATSTIAGRGEKTASDPTGQSEPTSAEQTTTEQTTTERRTAIVLLTDGQHNAGGSPVQSARILGGQGVPVYPVAFGSETPAIDLAVGRIELPQRVARQDRGRGTLELIDHLLPGTEFVAEVRTGDEVVWQQTLTATGEGRRSVDLSLDLEAAADRAAAQAGRDVERPLVTLPLEVGVRPLAIERDATNNRREVPIAVAMQTQRVLLLDGRPRWEARYLRNALQRDDRWELTSAIETALGDGIPRGDGGFPRTRDDLFAFDLLVLGEAPLASLSDEERAWIVDFVSTRGGGLVLIDSPRGVVRDQLAGPLATLAIVDWIGDPSALAERLTLTDLGERTPALRLVADRAANARFWQTLPAPRSPVAVRPRAGSETLVTLQPGDRPVILSRPVGAGQVWHFATDETWRWRYRAADTWHQRFWTQVATSVAPPPYAVEGKYLALETGGVRYGPGDRVAIRARLTQPDGKPATAPTITAQLRDRNGDRVVASVSLVSDPNVPGVYRGTADPPPPGDYRVTVEAVGFPAGSLKSSTQFQVAEPDSAERRETAADIALLDDVADASGGERLLEEQIARLTELLAPLSSGRIVETETPLGQSWWWLLAIVAILTAEWILRKQAGLI